MRRDARLQVRGIGLVAYPDPVLEPADGVAQRAAAAHRLSELDGQHAQHRFGLDVAAGPGDLVLQHLPDGEVLHQRHDVGERLVKRQHVGIGRLVEAAMHAVEDGVRRLRAR